LDFKKLSIDGSSEKELALGMNSGYLEIVREMASKYKGLSLIEFDGYFEGKMQPARYTLVEIHTNDFDKSRMTETANQIRVRLKQKGHTIEFTNNLIQVEE
jgi:hypothetical protein